MTSALPSSDSASPPDVNSSGSAAGDVTAATGFPLAGPDQVPATRLPTPDELALIRGRLDPAGQREKELS